MESTDMGYSDHVYATKRGKREIGKTDKNVKDPPGKRTQRNSMEICRRRKISVDP